MFHSLFIWQVSAWLELNERLMANGRFMVNCGGIDGGSSIMDGCTDPQISSSDETWLLNPAMKALSKVFPGQVGLLLLTADIVLCFPWFLHYFMHFTMTVLP